MSTNPDPEPSPGSLGLGADHPLKLTDCLRVPTEVMDRRVGDETVILHLATGTYFGLDPVGARMWELLASNHSLAEIRDRMLEEYATEPDRIEQDLLNLVQELLEHGLVEI